MDLGQAAQECLLGTVVGLSLHLHIQILLSKKVRIAYMHFSIQSLGLRSNGPCISAVDWANLAKQWIAQREGGEGTSGGDSTSQQQTTSHPPENGSMQSKFLTTPLPFKIVFYSSLMSSI